MTTGSKTESRIYRRGPYVYLHVGGLRARTRPRILVVAAAMLVVCCVLGFCALMMGDYPLSVGATLAALGGSEDNPLARYFVQSLRLPRVLCALAVGACLGTAGAIFQGLTRNPLGSPDITGFTVGAATGAVIQIIVFNAGPLAIGLGAVLGGFLTGAVVYLLAREGGLHGTTFVLVGLGLSFILQAFNSLLVVKASLDSAQTAAQWLAGSLNGVGWPQAVFLLVVGGVLVPWALLYSRDLSVLLNGDAIAQAVGVDVQRRRVGLLALGVVLSAVSVAVTGPVGFVALAAPQLARKLARNADGALLSSALMGALIMVASDILAQRLMAPVQLPVGVITGVVGGIYLMWILYKEWKASTI
ncbi:FecCD family ABC transporter permease [Corynebacterium flavescens]